MTNFQTPLRSVVRAHTFLLAGMWCVPEGRHDCRRVLNVTFGAKDGRGVCVPPSRYDRFCDIAGARVTRPVDSSASSDMYHRKEKKHEIRSWVRAQTLEVEVRLMAHCLLARRQETTAERICVRHILVMNYAGVSTFEIMHQ